MNGHAKAIFAVVLGIIGATLVMSSPGPAQPPGKGKMGKQDEAFIADRDVFHYLLSHRKEIRRTVKNLDNGVETVTESDNPEVAAKIREHVTAMHQRLKNGNGIHYRDPLFAEVFKHRDKITMKIEATKTGVRVVETSDDAYVVKLIQSHAVVVSRFIENGHDEVQRDHPLPKKD